MGPRFPTEAGKRRAKLVIGGFIALAILSFILARPNYPRSWPVDFNAFYCAGAAVANHDNPYRTEPLRSCENEARGFPAGRGFQFAVPAPLPGYALAPFALLSRMPFRLAAFVWVAVLLASFVATVLMLRILCEWRAETIVAALLLGEMHALYLGQIVPVVCAATVASAFFVSRENDRAAALAAMFSMFEPHLGLPVCFALFVARPGSRPVLAACGAALAVISVALLGIDRNIEYARDVLPAHTLSEISNAGQYSLTYLAHLAGLEEHAAAALGTLSYFAMVGFGIVGGRLAAARTGRPALLILLPPAFAILGGPFVHVTQLAIALPAALVLADIRLRSVSSCAVAVFLLAVPWDAIRFLNLNLPILAGVTLMLAIDLFASSLLRAALVSVCATAIPIALLNIIGGFPTAAVGPVNPSDGAALAETGWHTFVEVAYKPGIVPNMIAKLLGWGGMMLVALAAFGYTHVACSKPSEKMPNSART
jgi:hypothetical protein